MYIHLSGNKRSRGRRGAAGLLLLLLIFLGRLLFPPKVSWPAQLEILDMNGQSLYSTSSRIFTKKEDVPVFLRESMVQLEDKRFWHHRGIDIHAIGRALQANVRAHRIVQGASTIDQQLIKLQAQAYNRTFFQKIKEICGALKINIRLSKDEILLSYLNSIPFPYATVGVNGGCQLYFGKECASLSEHQLLFVIASGQLGSNPFRAKDFKRTKERAIFLCTVLSGSHTSGSHTSGSHTSGSHTSGSQEKECEKNYNQSPVAYTELIGKPISEMPHLIAYLLTQYNIGNSGGDEHASSVRKNMTISTHIDTQLYRHIQGTITTTFVQRQSVDAQDCCVLVMDGKGELISMNVCRERGEETAGQVNGCLAKRQTGSTIKPFLYTYALHQLGLKSTDTIVDEAVSYFLDDESAYTPKNFDLNYHGKVTIAQALGNSLNIPAVKLLHDAGVPGFVEFMARLRNQISQDSLEKIKQDSEKFSADRQGLSLALGTYELSPLEFAKLWKMRFLPKTSFVQTYEEQIKDLSAVLQDPHNRIISFGQENYLNVPGWIVKTGTSRHFVDGRVCGANTSKDRIVCVWMGNYNAKPMNASSVTTAGYLRRLVIDAL